MDPEGRARDMKSRKRSHEIKDNVKGHLSLVHHTTSTTPQQILKLCSFLTFFFSFSFLLSIYQIDSLFPSSPHSQPTMTDTQPREHHVYLAKLAEQAERYEGRPRCFLAHMSTPINVATTPTSADQPWINLALSQSSFLVFPLHSFITPTRHIVLFSLFFVWVQM